MTIITFWRGYLIFSTLFHSCILKTEFGGVNLLLAVYDVSLTKNYSVFKLKIILKEKTGG